jgi:hypothetical protein
MICIEARSPAEAIIASNAPDRALGREASSSEFSFGCRATSLPDLQLFDRAAWVALRRTTYGLVATLMQCKRNVRTLGLPHFRKPKV